MKKIHFVSETPADNIFTIHHNYKNIRSQQNININPGEKVLICISNAAKHLVLPISATKLKIIQKKILLCVDYVNNTNCNIKIKRFDTMYKHFKKQRVHKVRL